MHAERVVQFRYVGRRSTGDITIDTPEHLFVANGIATSNCRAHAFSYSAVSCAELWLKYHYPTEYMAALLNHTDLSKKKWGEDLFVRYVNYCRKRSIEVIGPDINRSGESFTIEDGKIRFSLSHIKNVASSALPVVNNQPYASVADFYDRAAVTTKSKDGKDKARRVNRKVFESLVFAGAFDSFSLVG